MTGKQLTAQNAVIKTATVEIKALTVSGRQVTQSVFRQLREEPLIAEDGTLNGVPWGYVNFHPDKCSDGPKHWHVVWQRGEDLLRSKVFAEISFAEFGCEEADVRLDAWIYRWARGELRSPFSGRVPTRYEASQYGIGTRHFVDSNTNIRFACDASDVAEDVAVKKLGLDEAEAGVIEPFSYFGYCDKAWRGGNAELAALLELAVKAGIKVSIGVDRQLRIDTPEDRADICLQLRANESAVTALLERQREGNLRAADLAIEELNTAMSALHGEVAEAGTWTEISARFRVKCQEELARRTRHREVRKALSQLPQLFIAT